MKKIHTIILSLLPSILFTPTTLADTKTATSTQAVISNTERARVESIVHDYLVKKPEVLIEAMQTLQKKEMEHAQTIIKQTTDNAPKFADALFHIPNDPIGGNPKGKITVVEFFDYQCPHCVAMSATLDKTIKDNTNVRVIYKELPIRGPMSELAARAALAANKQGKYNEMHHKLMANTQPLSETVILNLAKSVGINNTDQFKKEMHSDEVNKILSTNMKLRDDLNLLGTPAIFVGKTTATAQDKVQYAPGRVNEPELEKMIKLA